jgi:hypothetical protein
MKTHFNAADGAGLASRACGTPRGPHTRIAAVVDCVRCRGTAAFGSAERTAKHVAHVAATTATPPVVVEEYTLPGESAPALWIVRQGPETQLHSRRERPLQFIGADPSFVSDASTQVGRWGWGSRWLQHAADGSAEAKEIHHLFQRVRRETDQARAEEAERRDGYARLAAQKARAVQLFARPGAAELPFARELSRIGQRLGYCEAEFANGLTSSPGTLGTVTPEQADEILRAFHAEAVQLRPAIDGEG